MFKKLLKNLTQSKEEQYLADLEAIAAEFQSVGNSESAAILRRFAILKQDIDERLDSKDADLLQIEGLAGHALAICDAAIVEVRHLAKITSSLPDILTSRDAGRLATFMSEFQSANQSLMRGYTVLERAAMGSGPVGFEESSVQGEKSTMDQAAESLLVDLRTAERIRNELGN